MENDESVQTTTKADSPKKGYVICLMGFKGDHFI